MFLKDDQERAQKEVNCYEYCLNCSVDSLKQQEFGEASEYLENAARSLRELERLKVAKQTFDNAWFQLKQIEGQQAVDRTIAELRSRL